MFCALDRMLDGGLDDFLRAYYERYAFGRATREGFESLLAETTGEDLTPFDTRLPGYLYPELTQAIHERNERINGTDLRRAHGRGHPRLQAG